MNKLLAICILCLLVFVSIANADYFKATKVGNIRSGPGTLYDIVGQSNPASDQWQILKIEGAWIKIGNDRWIYKSLGEITNQPTYRSASTGGECPEVDYDAVKQMIRKEYTVSREFTTSLPNLTNYSLTDLSALKEKLEKKEELERKERNKKILKYGIIGWLLFWLVPSYMCSVAADKKGLNKWGFFFFSLIFSAIVGLLALNAFPAKRKF